MFEILSLSGRNELLHAKMRTSQRIGHRLLQLLNLAHGGMEDKGKGNGVLEMTGVYSDFAVGQVKRELALSPA